MGTIKCNDHGQIKAPKHPHSECLDSLTTLVPHEWAVRQGQCTPMNIHYIRHMNVGTIKYDDHGQIKAPKHPRSECLDSLTTLVPHEWAVRQGQCTPP